MSEINREGLKNELQAFVAGRGDGIDIDTPFQLVIEGVKDPLAFFSNLPHLLPDGSILYVEGTRIAADMAAFYSSHHAPNAVAVVRDTIFPPPDIYHFTFSCEVCATLEGYARKRPVSEMFNHIKAYRGQSLLFTFHDAFDGWLIMSEHLPEEAVGNFCKALGVERRREPTKKRDPELLRKLLWAMENPHKIKIAGEPWWKRLRRRWFG